MGVTQNKITHSFSVPFLVFFITVVRSRQTAWNYSALLFHTHICFSLFEFFLEIN